MTVRASCLTYSFFNQSLLFSRHEGLTKTNPLLVADILYARVAWLLTNSKSPNEVETMVKRFLKHVTLWLNISKEPKNKIFYRIKTPHPIDIGQ